MKILLFLPSPLLPCWQVYKVGFRKLLLAEDSENNETGPSYFANAGPTLTVSQESRWDHRLSEVKIAALTTSPPRIYTNAIYIRVFYYRRMARVL